MSILHKKVPISAFLAERDPHKQADLLILLFTYVDWAGTREAICAFLTCPLLRSKWAVAWDIATTSPRCYLQVGPRNGRHNGKARKANGLEAPTAFKDVPPEREFWRKRFVKQDHERRFRANRLFYLSDAGTKRAFELGRVRASYGWRSTSSKARGVADQVDILTKTKAQRKADYEAEQTREWGLL